MYSSIFDHKVVNKRPETFFQNQYSKKIRANVVCKSQNYLIIENKVQNHDIGCELYSSCTIKNEPRHFIIFRGWIKKNKIKNVIKNFPLMFKGEFLYYMPVNPLKINKYSNQINEYKNIIYTQRVSDAITSYSMKTDKYKYVNMSKKTNTYI